MTIGTIFTLFIVPSLYMLIAKQHGGAARAETEPASTPDEEALPELAYARGNGNGNGWKSH
jgi:hypothetical protein